MHYETQFCFCDNKVLRQFRIFRNLHESLKPIASLLNKNSKKTHCEDSKILNTPLHNSNSTVLYVLCSSNYFA